MISIITRITSCCLLGIGSASGYVADGQTVDFAARTQARASIDRALEYLAGTQRQDGAWEAFEKPNPAITALAVKALTQDQAFGPNHPAVRRGLSFVLRFVQQDGGIYVPDSGMRNYHTSVALMALAATRDPAHAETIRRAQTFLKKLQWDGGEGHETSSAWYGGQGYGRHKRPDLSNTQLMLEALKQSGLPADDPVYQKALVFVSRCQMLGETNDQPFAKGSSDGGFVYTPVGGGESKAGTRMEDETPRLRSYGSMSYAGFKSMLYARVDRNDVRVRRAVEWIKRHYTLATNPNMPDEQSQQGLYYYYFIFAKTMQAWGVEELTDGHGVPRRWRTELIEALAARQREDGSWANEADRWYEGNPHLVTSYAVLALQTALTPGTKP